MGFLIRKELALYRQVAMCVFQNVRDMKYCINKPFVFKPQEDDSGVWRSVGVAWWLVSRQLEEATWYCMRVVLYESRYIAVAKATEKVNASSSTTIEIFRSEGDLSV